MATLEDERNNVPSPTYPDEFLGDNAGMISSGPWCHGTFLLLFLYLFVLVSFFGCFFHFVWLSVLVSFFACFFTLFGYAFPSQCKCYPPKVSNANSALFFLACSSQHFFCKNFEIWFYRERTHIFQFFNN